MKIMDLNRNWKVVSEGVESDRDLPFDALVGSAKDYSCAFGELNGYFPAARATFVKELPAVKAERAILSVGGACGFGDVFLNDDLIGRLTGQPFAADVAGKLDGVRNTLRIELTSLPGMSDKYIGLGINDVKLSVEESLDFETGSLFVSTEEDGDKTFADVTVTVHNIGPAQKIIVECIATNARGKRAGKKQRKIFIRSNATVNYLLRVRINRPYAWTPTDPYMYSLTARILAADGEEREISTSFGIVSRAFSYPRGLYFNGVNTRLFGGVVSHADAVLGGASNYSNEMRRFEALKDVGYNAVRFDGCPSEAALCALDDIGMYAFVNIFDTLVEGKAPLDSHIFGMSEDARREAVALAVQALRNHPSVALYGVGGGAESYGRSGGHKVIADVAKAIREVDSTRPVVVSSREEVPTSKELERAGVRKRAETDAAAISAGREKDLFNTLTEGAFENADVCGFDYLYQLYSADRLKHSRLLLGSSTDPERAFESIEETEKYPYVVGDFVDCAMDWPGGGGLNASSTRRGDIDSIGDIKPRGEYKRIILGERNSSFITVLDPDTEEPVAMWNWPRHLGQTVTVQVVTSGDVVALYLDGRLIGRKLAGKINKHIATFETEFYPGTLEAISYFKGVECSRARLKSATSPKTIRLYTADKNLSVSRGDLGFVHIDVCDRDGTLVPYAMRTLSATVSGGTLVGFINADPMLRKSDFESCPAYGGKALCVVKPDPAEDKAVVKITGDGLLAAKLTFKIKE